VAVCPTGPSGTAPGYAYDGGFGTKVLAPAEDLGAAGAYEDAKEIEHFEPEVIIDFAGFDVTIREALEAIGFQGKVVLVGMGKLETTLNVTSLITKQATLVGSNGGTKQDIEDIYELFASGKVSPKVTEITFDEIPEGIQMLEDGKVTGRLVANMEK